MKKSIFAVMAFVFVALLAGCKKESNSEIAATVSEVTDSSVVIQFEFNPQKSVRYQLNFEGCSFIYDKSRSVSFSNLASGKKYSVVVTAQDADNNEVEHKVVEFMTSGEPDNSSLFKNMLYMIGDEYEFEVTDTLPNEVSITFTCNYSAPYVIAVNNPDGDYKQSQRITTAEKTTVIFTGLESGVAYTMFVEEVWNCLAFLGGFEKQ